MPIFLGKSKSYLQEGREILSFRTGPGGLIAGCISRHQQTSVLDFSIWIIAGEELLHIESLTLPLTQTIGTTPSQTKGDIFWHPSGNSVYILHGRQLLLLKVEWGDLYQHNRQVSLAEFYSLFLCEYHEGQEEGGSHGVNLHLVRAVSDVTATTLHMSLDRNCCFFCNAAMSAEGASGTAITVATSDLKRVTSLNIPTPSSAALQVLTPEQALLVHMSPLHATPPAATGDTNALNCTTSPFQLCKDQNSRGVVLGFSRDCLFLMQQDPARPTEFTVSSPVRLSVSPEVQKVCERSGDSSSSSSRCVDTLAEETIREQEDKEIHDDDDDYNNDNDDVYGETDNYEENFDEDCLNMLDMEAHGEAISAGGCSPRRAGTGRICDVVCMEPPYELHGGLDMSTSAVFYVMLLEHTDITTASECTYELICIKVYTFCDSDNSPSSNHNNNTYSCRIISRVPVIDSKSPLSTHCDEEQAHASVPIGVGADSCHRLQCLRSDSNAPTGLLVHLPQTIQCIGICGLGLEEVAARTWTEHNTASLPAHQIFQSVLFTLDVGSIGSGNNALSTVSVTVAANRLLIATSSRTSSLASSSTNKEHSCIHSVSLLSSQTQLAACVTASAHTTGTTLLDVSEGVVLVFGTGNTETCLEGMTCSSSADLYTSERGGTKSASGAALKPEEGQMPSFDCRSSRVVVPPPLIRDMILNRCKFKCVVKSKAGDASSPISAVMIAKEQLMNDAFSVTGGLISATIESPGADRRGYIASAIAVSPSLAVPSQAGLPSRHDTLAHHSYIWVQSTVTSKWKILHNPDAPPTSSIVLLLYNSPSLSSSSPPGKIYPSRKKYHDNQNALMGLLKIGWFEDHSIFMCTIRKPSHPSASFSGEENLPLTHCCLEVMSRASEQVPSVTVEHNKYRNGRRDLRRVSAANVHVVVPLPAGFVPVMVDCLSVSPESCYSSMEQPRHRSMSMTSTDVDSNLTVNGLSKVCLILLGNASGHFLALQVTAASSSLPPDEGTEKRQTDSTNTNTSNPATTVPADAFKPTKYTVTLVWQCDISTNVRSSWDPAYFVATPLRSAHVLVSKGKTQAQSPHDVGMLLLDMAGSVIKVGVFCGKDHPVEHGDQEIENVQPLTTETYGNQMYASFINKGGCSSVLRVSSHNRVCAEKYYSGDFTSHLENLFVLTSSCGGSDDVLYLALSHTGDGSKMDRAMQAPVRPAGSIPVDSLDCLSYRQSLSYASPITYLPEAQHLAQTNETHSDAKSEMDPHSLPLTDRGVARGSLPLVLNQSLVSLSVIVGLLNFHIHPPPRWLDSPLTDAMLIPYYTYRHSTVAIVGELIASMQRKRNSTTASILADGIESHMKSMIQASGFTRHSPEFAIMTTVLFAADEMFFIDIFSKLARKLEPHVSLKLFPLPNYTPGGLKVNEQLSSSDTARKQKYVDSFWNQLTLFEFCLHKKSLMHASRFLTIACEHLGGSQSIETIAACLIVATELVFESLRHMSLETALECLDFCVRLEMMATELIAADDLFLEEAQEGGGEGMGGSNLSSTGSQMLHFVQVEVIGVMGLLAPLLGSDLHDVLEDAVDPHNSRNRIGFSLYNRPLYAHPQLKYRLDKTDPEDTSPQCVSFGHSSLKYFAFCAANKSVGKRINLQESVDVSESSEWLGGQNDKNTLEKQMQLVSPVSYTSTIVSQVVTTLVKAQQWCSVSVMMRSIQQHVLECSKLKASWLEESLYFNNMHLWAQQQPLRNHSFRGSHIAGMMQRVGLPSSLRMCPACPLDDHTNDDIREILVRELSAIYLQHQCEEEMTDDRNFSDNGNTYGSVVTMSRDALCTMDNGDSTPSTASTNAKYQEGASRLFALPEATPDAMSLVNFLQGTAAAALLSKHLEVVLFIAVILCQKDIAAACLCWDDLASRREVIEFFLSRSKKSRTKTRTTQECSSSVTNMEEEGVGHRSNENSDSCYKDEQRALLNRLFSINNTVSVRNIADEILHYYSKIEEPHHPRQQDEV